MFSLREHEVPSEMSLCHGFGRTSPYFRNRQLLEPSARPLGISLALHCFRWDRWQKDKKKYEAFLLSKIRKQCLEKYAEVQYTVLASEEPA